MPAGIWLHFGYADAGFLQNYDILRNRRGHTYRGNCVFRG